MFDAQNPGVFNRSFAVFLSGAGATNLGCFYWPFIAFELPIPGVLTNVWHFLVVFEPPKKGVFTQPFKGFLSGT